MWWHRREGELHKDEAAVVPSNTQLPGLGNKGSLDRNLVLPGISSAQPSLDPPPGRAGSGGWCAACPCSRHGHSASGPAGCGGAAEQEKGTGQTTGVNPNQHFRCEPTLVLDRSATCIRPLDISFFFLIRPV